MSDKTPIAGRGFHRAGIRYQSEITTLEMIELREQYNVYPLMYWNDKFKTWNPCQRDTAEDIDRVANRLLFSDGLVWIPMEQVFIVLSGPYSLNYTVDSMDEE
jgi:hypothetical protein